MSVLRIEPMADEFRIFLERKSSVYASGPTINSTIGRFGFYHQQETNLVIALHNDEWRICKRLSLRRVIDGRYDYDELRLLLVGLSSPEPDLLFEFLGCFLYLQQEKLGLDIRWKEDLPGIVNKVVRFPLRGEKKFH